MDASIAKAIVAAADDIGIEVKLFEDYSGRGMYGRTTTGVVGELATIIQAIAYAAQLATENDRCEGQDDGPDPDKFIDSLGNLSTDNMGHSDIILY